MLPRILAQVRRAAALLTAACLVATARPAPAQSGYGNASLILSPPSAPHDARAVMAAFADCEVKRRRPQIMAFLAKPFDDFSKKDFDRLDLGECLEDVSALTMERGVLRGALFVALYRADYSEATPGLSTKPIDFLPDVRNTKPAEARAYLTLEDFGDCIVRADPVGSRSVVLARTGSPQEGQALTSLGSRFGACFPAGLKAKLNKASIIGLLGESLYREAAASTAERPAAEP